MPHVMKGLVGTCEMLRWHGVECVVGKQSRLNRCYDLDTNTRRTPTLHIAFSVTNSSV